MTWTRPHPDALHPKASAALWAVLVLGRATVTTVAQHTGLPRLTVYYHLCGLRDAGYITWESGKHATIRATMTPTPPPRRSSDEAT